MIFPMLMACGGASLETRVEELRVMAIKPIPAEMTPEDSLKIEFLIPNPPQNSAQFLYWTCTNLGDGCLEKEYTESTGEQWGQVQTIDNENILHQVDFELPPVITALLSQLPGNDPFGASLLWVLACEESRCPLIQDWEAGQPDLEAMNSPFELMETLPKKGTSLAFRPLILSNRPEAERIQHPILTFNGDESPSLKGPEGSQTLPFTYELNRLDESSDALYYAYTTQGGFAMNDRYTTLLQSESGEFTAEWFGTEDLEKGTAQLMVILENGEGGISFWTKEGIVQ